MFNFHKYALITSSPNQLQSTNNQICEKYKPLLTGNSFGDLVLILKQDLIDDNNNIDINNSDDEQPEIESMSYVQRVNIHSLHKHGYKLYDHRNKPQKPPLLTSTGWIPTSYLTTILPDPLVCNSGVNHNRSLDLSRALVEREEDIEQAEQYQREFGMRMDNYETYCRDVYKFECWKDVVEAEAAESAEVNNNNDEMVKKKISTQRAHVHCLEAGKYDEFNICVESFEKQKSEWKKLAAEKYSESREVFFVKNSKHPGYLHFLIRSAYISETIVNALSAFRDRPCLGYRRRISPTEFESFHRWFTYEQLHERVMRFGLGLYQYDKLFLNQSRPFPVEEGRGFVGICASNRPDWFVADWACLTQSFISVALPQTKVNCISEDISMNSMESAEVLKGISHEIICILTNSQIPLLVCSRDLTVKFLKLIKRGLLPSVRIIVQMEDLLLGKELDEKSFEEEPENYLKNLRATYHNKLKEQVIRSLQQGGDYIHATPFYYLMKNRYKHSNWNMSVSIEDLCDFEKSGGEEFIVQNYISENDFNLDCKSLKLAKELSIELTDMTSVELSTFKDYPIFNESLKFNIRTNNSVNDLTTIVYTSGSTSTEPKGAVMTDKQYNDNVQLEIYQYHPLVFISYAPLSHITDRVNTTACMINGGRSGFNCGEMDKVFEDYQSIQPVTESNTPRFYNILYAEYQRLRNLEGSVVITPEVEESIMQKVRSMLGGRIKSLVTGGASTSPHVLQFLKDCFKCNVYNGYSSTECGYIGPIGTDGVDYLSEKVKEENKKLPKHMMQLKDVLIKLESVPELGYFITDEPFARGEICVKSSTIISGYYRDTEKTQQSFDSENFFQTADIGEIDKDKLRLRIIDRKKNIFKLSQGEFVAPENLENLFISKTQFVDQIYLYGHSENSFLVAVIVPKNLPLLYELAMKMGQEVKAFEKRTIRNEKELLSSDLSRNGLLYRVIQNDMNKIAREAKLESYEIPKGFIIEMEMFTPENGKMTASYKLCRPALLKGYKQQLEELYKEIEKEDMSNLDQVSNKADLEEFLKKLFESGGIVDSLSSVRLSNILSQKLGIKLGADKILQECKNSSSEENPSTAIMQMIDRLMENGKLVEGGDNHDDALFRTEEELLEEVRNLIKDIPVVVDDQESLVSSNNKNQNILITGSTGFIGVGLVCEQLFATADSFLTCIIRGKSLEEERERLLTGVLNYCYHFAKEQKEFLLEMFNRRVSIILGDISLNHFGLNEEIYQQLTLDIDTVIHCAANVNFIMNYSQLKQVNVQSTIECLKLCTTSRMKHLHFVSTISVIPYTVIDQYKKVNELVPEDFIPLSLEYFNNLSDGYPQSKYIAEHALLLAMKERNFTTLKIYRPGLVVGHTMNGFSSVREWICRLMCGFCHLGEIPIEYSKHGMQVIPVNCCARAIINQVVSNSSSNNYSKVVHHLTNWNKLYRTIDDIVEAMKRLNFVWKLVSYKTWIENIHNLMAQQSTIHPLMNNQNSILGIIHMFPIEHGLLNIDSTMEEHVSSQDLNNLEIEIIDDIQLVVKEFEFLIRSGQVSASTHANHNNQ